MQATTEAVERLIAQLQAGGSAPPPPRPPLNIGGGDGTSSDMEARIAVLEADMKHVKEQLAKLAEVPSDLATLKERTSHLPTKADMHSEISTQSDRLGTRMQRQVTVTGAVFTLVLALITLAARLVG